MITPFPPLHLSHRNKIGICNTHSSNPHTYIHHSNTIPPLPKQAIGLLDDIDKELNTYAMRVREWFGWHFPEMGKIVTDHVQYAKVIKAMGMRTRCPQTELSTILDDETESELREAALVSMGTEISDEDLTNIRQLCDQVIDMSEYRTQLYEYFQNRMRVRWRGGGCMDGWRVWYSVRYSAQKVQETTHVCQFPCTTQT